MIIWSQVCAYYVVMVTYVLSGLMMSTRRLLVTWVQTSESKKWYFPSHWSFFSIWNFSKLNFDFFINLRVFLWNSFILEDFWAVKELHESSKNFPWMYSVFSKDFVDIPKTFKRSCWICFGFSRGISRIYLISSGDFHWLCEYFYGFLWIDCAFLNDYPRHTVCLQAVAMGALNILEGLL